MSRPSTGLGLRSALAAAGALAVLAGSATAGPGTPLPVAVAEAAPVPARSTSMSTSTPTVRVDPAACAHPSAHRGARVVCSPAQAPEHLIDGGTLLLSGVTHSGPLDLRNRRRVTVRGLPGAVLDAGAGRYALSLRDVSQVTVEGLTLRGGTAQTVWLERTTGVTVRDATIERSAGAGVQLRDTTRFTLSSSRVRDSAAAGVMELTGVTDSAYRALTVTGNGRGAGQYNGDGLQLSGTRVTVSGVVATGNGSSPLYEHGVYVSAAARAVRLEGVTASGNSGVAVKLGGSGTLATSTLADDRIALYCGSTAGEGWTVGSTAVSAPQPRHAEKGCRWSG